MSGEVTQPPAGHGPTFGEAVDGETAIGQIRCNGRKAVVLLPLREQEFVDLITHHQQLGMTTHHLRHGFKLLAWHHPTGRVTGCIQHKQATARRDRCFQGVDVELEPILGLGRDQLHLGAGQGGHLRVAQPVGRRQKHLISRIQQHLKQVVDRLLAAVGDQNLLGCGGDAVGAGQLLGDGCTELRLSSRWAVAGDAIPQCFPGGLNDEVRGVEVRFSGAEAADITTRAFQCLGLGRDG